MPCLSWWVQFFSLDLPVQELEPAIVSVFEMFFLFLEYLVSAKCVWELMKQFHYKQRLHLSENNV